MNVKCLVCERPLVAIGHNRVNGQCHSDWASRKYHSMRQTQRLLLFFTHLNLSENLFKE